MKKSIITTKPWKGSVSTNLQLIFPANFLMLCSLLDIEPDKVLRDFMRTLGKENYGLGEEQQLQAQSYFLKCRYGRELYAKKEIQQIFHELGCVSALWPDDDNEKILDIHANWRDQYHKYWYKKWYCKARRRI